MFPPAYLLRSANDPAPNLYANRINTEKPGGMPLPVSRGWLASIAASQNATFCPPWRRRPVPEQNAGQGRPLRPPVIASEAKQSILSLCGSMDCFASLAMTVIHMGSRSRGMNAPEF